MTQPTVEKQRTAARKKMNDWRLDVMIRKAGGNPAHPETRRDECWTWVGRLTQHGYGRWLGSMAHRAVYMKLVGPIGKGLHIDHLCFNRACVNPAHLEPVTPAENNRRSLGRPRKLPSVCPKGHVYTIVSNPDGSTRRRCDTCMHYNIFGQRPPQ